MTQLELELANHIRAVLPAASYPEIAQMVSQRSGREVTVGTINDILSKIRRSDLDWTVPYVKRGPAKGRHHRFFVMDRPLTSENIIDFREGDLSTLLSTQGIFKVYAKQNRQRAMVAESPSEHRHYYEAAMDADYFANKLEFRIQEMRASMAA